MNTYLPPGRAIVAVAPRPGALTAITERVRERRRRRKRTTALAGLAATVAVVAPLVFHADPFTTGLEPARPGITPSAVPHPRAGNAPGGPFGHGPARPAATDRAGDATRAVPAPSPQPAATPPGDGPAQAGTLTITGSDSGYAVIRVERTTTADLASASVTSLGEYTGFVVDGVEVLFLRGMADGLGTPTYQGATTVVLRPGPHRVYLLTPAGSAATVRIPWSGAPVTVQPSVPIDVDYQRPQSMFTQDGGGRGDTLAGTTASSVTIVAATFDPAPAGVTLTGCFGSGTDPTQQRCAHDLTTVSDGTSVRLSDRMAGLLPAGASYSVAVRNAVSPGVLRFVVFRYDRD